MSQTPLERAAELASVINERSAVYSDDLAYYLGKQPLSFVSPKSKELIKLNHLGSNICRLQANSLVERLRIIGLTLNEKTNDGLYRDWLAAGMDQGLATLLREAVAFRRGYAIVWDSSGKQRPRVTIESSRTMAVRRDPETREILEGVKVWRDGNDTHVVLYGADAIYRFKSTDETGVSGLKAVGETANPLGTPPVAEVLNADLASGYGVCEFQDTKPLVDALNKQLVDMMTTSEAYARPRRWAAGIEMGTDDEGEPKNPFPATDDMAIAEEHDAKFGQWEAANLQAYGEATRVIISQIQAVSSLPGHYLGTLQGQPSSADANRSAEASLAARAEGKQSSLGEGLERVAQLIQGIKTKTDPLSHRVGLQWADPATRSEGQAADAAVKLHAEGLLSRKATLRRLGYTDDQIEADLEELRKERREAQVDQLVAAPIEAQNMEPAPADDDVVL